ncbi:hypothetical protein HN51_069535 [Arachis hypogaea]
MTALFSGGGRTAARKGSRSPSPSLPSCRRRSTPPLKSASSPWNPSEAAAVVVWEDFDEFSDVDELYSSLPLDKVETLEDLVTIPPGLSKVTSLPLLLSLPSFEKN